MTQFERTEEQAYLDTAALKMRSLDYTYQKIADSQGTTKATAYNRVQRALKAIPAEAVDEYRRVEGERISLLMEKAMEKALSGDKGFLFAIDRCVTLMDRRARLMGLDTPVTQKLEVTRYEGGTDLDREFQAFARLYANSQGNGGESAVGAEPSETGTTTD